jgi:Protein of unknown function (DUF1580)
MSEQKHDFASEAKITFQDARKLCPGQPSIVSLWRWSRKGVKGVRLEYQRVGRKMFTTAEALARFFAALTALDVPIEQKPAAPRRPSSSRQVRREGDRKRAVEGARAKLAAAGI